MFSISLMFFPFWSFSLLLYIIARNYGIFDIAFLFDSESSLCPFHFLQVSWSGNTLHMSHMLSQLESLFDDEDLFFPAGLPALFLFYISLTKCIAKVKAVNQAAQRNNLLRKHFMHSLSFYYFFFHCVISLVCSIVEVRS